MVNLNKSLLFLLLIFIYIILGYFFIAVTTRPYELDSLYYHIPFAKMILNGTIFNHSAFSGNVFYFPAASEIILAFFILLHIPLNLFNVIGLLILFLSLYRLALTFKLSKSNSLIFALSVSVLPAFTRWLPTQIIDIWLAIFFIWSIILLEKAEKRTVYFIVLGIVLGFLIGSKLNGVLFAMVLLFIYRQQIIKNLNFINLPVMFLFIVPLGFSWYIRNYGYTGNPFYPFHFLIFKGLADDVFVNSHVITVSLANIRYLSSLANSLISEYVIWAFLILIIPYLLLKSLYSRKIVSPDIKKLFIIGLANFIIFLILPAWKDNIISSLRYSYCAFIPLILVIFIYFNKTDLTSYLLTAGLLSSIPSLQLLRFQPKLVVITFIFFLLITTAFKKLIHNLQ